MKIYRYVVPSAIMYIYTYYNTLHSNIYCSLLYYFKANIGRKRRGKRGKKQRKGEIRWINNTLKYISHMLGQIGYTFLRDATIYM